MLNLTGINNLSNYKYVRETVYTKDDTTVNEGTIPTGGVDYVVNNSNYTFIQPYYPYTSYPYLKVSIYQHLAKFDLFSKVDTGSIFVCNFAPHINSEIDVLTVDEIWQFYATYGLSGEVNYMFKKGQGHPAYSVLSGDVYVYTPWSTQNSSGTATGSPVYRPSNTSVAQTTVPTAAECLLGQIRILEMKTTNFI